MYVNSAFMETSLLPDQRPSPVSRLIAVMESEVVFAGLEDLWICTYTVEPSYDENRYNEIVLISEGLRAALV